MSTQERVRDPLEIAAASPDPVIRTMALRYRALEQQKVQLDAFFSVYSGVEAVEDAPAPPQAPAHERARPPAPKARPSPRSATLGDNVHEILVAAGRPLEIGEIATAYRARFPQDAARTGESLRVAMAKQRTRFPRSVNGNGTSLYSAVTGDT